MVIDVKKLYEKDHVGKEVILQGWIRSHRKQKNLDLLIFMMELVLNQSKLYMKVILMILKIFKNSKQDVHLQ